MILEFVYGAIQQVGRFIGGIPTALGWSGSAAAASAGGTICGTFACAPALSGTCSTAAVVSGTCAAAPVISGTFAVEEC